MRSDWNRRAAEDAYYYVAFARPGQSTAEFLSSASIILPTLEAELIRLPPSSHRRALEIGCGPGRLMLPMSRHFDEIHGVDVSDEMILLGRDLLRDTPNATLHVNNGQDLSAFPDEYFDFAYSFVVFQHIPLKAVVLNYLREIRRVLKPGGILLCQLRGLPASTRGGAQTNTWTGCSFAKPEVVDFSRAHGFQLVAFSGEGTQYMLATFRKPLGPPAAQPSNGVVNAVTSTRDASSTVPQRGPQSAVCLWTQGLPDNCGLENLAVTFNGIEGSICYLSPLGPYGACQINVLLPKNTPTGKAEVALFVSGQRVGEKYIDVIAAPPRRPAIVSVTDGIDLNSPNRITSASLKVILQDIENPSDVSFQIGGGRAEFDVQCTNPILEEFEFTLPIPPGLGPGHHSLLAGVEELNLPPVMIEMARA
jgi:SAM-dependent methyltransferase